ncbi:protein phosphatase 1 regulatory subunit 14D isoform X2 [Dama dama]|uniref:protein phosphatase 1 regulatory subunit 14D isoform X2 n=1 Tax=Dama dama TaxID=30532 RepID=UPI002A369A3C|nr:protein phosphatase 1 regulatory subunit 14D isoform X2 [Dama dama]
MLSSSPTSCTSPNPDKENPSKKVQWASGRRRRTSSTDSESKSQSDPFRPRSRKPSRLTVKINQLLQSLRSTWRLSWNYPQRSRRLSWRLFSKTAPAPQSLLSLSCSVNSRNFRDSVDLRNKPYETSFISLSTAQSALNPWILGWVGNSSLGPRRGTWRMRRDI